MPATVAAGRRQAPAREPPGTRLCGHRGIVGPAGGARPRRWASVTWAKCCGANWNSNPAAGGGGCAEAASRRRAVSPVESPRRRRSSRRRPPRRGQVVVGGGRPSRARRSVLRSSTPNRIAGSWPRSWLAHRVAWCARARIVADGRNASSPWLQRAAGARRSDQHLAVGQVDRRDHVHRAGVEVRVVVRVLHRGVTPPGPQQVELPRRTRRATGSTTRSGTAPCRGRRRRACRRARTLRQ